MALKFNGTTITGDYTVKYGNTELTKIVYNGTTVWEKNTQKTYRYYITGVLVGTSSGINGSYPTTSGNFTINSTYGAMWAVSTTANDYTGYSTSFATCMGKTIVEMKMFVYRNNTQTFNTTASNSGWIYNPPPTSGGCKALVMSASALNSAGYTHVDTTTPVPATSGLVQVSLTTAQLQACFSGTTHTISAAAGHSPTQLPAGSYKTLGLRGLYSNNPQFKCYSNNATYGYIEITAK